jgi:hypothetical protein
MSKNIDRAIGATVFLFAVGVVVGASFLVENEAKRTIWPTQQASQVSELADMVVPLQDTVIWDEREISALNMKLSKLEGRNKGLQVQLVEAEKQKCAPAPAPVVTEREADPANCSALKDPSTGLLEFRGYDERKNVAADFKYLANKLPMFNGTHATQDSRNRFRCLTLYQGQIRQYRN